MARGAFDNMGGGTMGGATARGATVESGKIKRPPSRLPQAPSKDTWKSSQATKGSSNNNLDLDQAKKFKRDAALKKAAGNRLRGRGNRAGVAIALGGTVTAVTKERPRALSPDAPERRGIKMQKEFEEISKDWKNYKGNNPAQQEIEDKLKKAKESLKNK